MVKRKVKHIAVVVLLLLLPIHSYAEEAKVKPEIFRCYTIFSVTFGEKTPRLLGEDFSTIGMCKTTGQRLIQYTTSSITWCGLQNTGRRSSMDRLRNGYGTSYGRYARARRWRLSKVLSPRIISISSCRRLPTFLSQSSCSPSREKHHTSFSRNTRNSLGSSGVAAYGAGDTLPHPPVT